MAIDFDSLDDVPESLLEKTLEEFGGVEDVEIRIYRTGPKYHGKQIYVQTVNPEHFSFDMLRDELGGGDFRIHIRAGGKIRKNVAVSVEEKPKEERTVQPQSDERFTMMIQAMQAGFQGLAEIMVQNQVNQQPLKSSAETMQETLNMMVAMKQVMGGNEQRDPTEAIKMGIELAKEIGSSDRESSTMDVLLESIKTFGAPIAKAAMNQNLQMFPAGGKPGQPMIPGANPNQKTNTEGAAMNALKSGIGMLVAQAKTNKDPGLYADLVLDQVPAELLYRELSKPDWFEGLSGMHSGVAECPEWFHELRNLLIGALTEEFETGIDIENPSGPKVLHVAGSETAESTENPNNGDPASDT